ncbi:MAG: response regulator [Actinomycetota bacterium]|nr:response regulator [Actinomycetota bacterium]
MSDRPVILVADDDADILLLLSLMLERDGYDVVTARDGRDALDAARERAPDLIVLDLMMPMLDGCAVTRELRADARTRATPVVILTAFAEEGQAAAAVAAGADAYMKKPFSSRELLATAASLLVQRPRAATPERSG